MAPATENGRWGQPTSTLDWCEENYFVTDQIAEFSHQNVTISSQPTECSQLAGHVLTMYCFGNTISNVIMILPPLVCAVYFWENGVEKRHVLSNLSLLAVGIGSWMFHMTLWYEMQLLDELPMIYGTCVFLYSLHHHARPPKSRSMLYIVCLVIFSVVVTVVYLYWKNPVFHQVCYATLVLILCYEAIIACKNYPEIRPIVLSSLLFYLFGFFLWNIDNIFCSHLRILRAESSNYSPVKVVTQLHAWWHIFTGYATNLHILFSSYARTLYLKRSCSVQNLAVLAIVSAIVSRSFFKEILAIYRNAVFPR